MFDRIGHGLEDAVRDNDSSDRDPRNVRHDRGGFFLRPLGRTHFACIRDCFHAIRRKASPKVAKSVYRTHCMGTLSVSLVVIVAVIVVATATNARIAAEEDNPPRPSHDDPAVKRPAEQRKDESVQQRNREMVLGKATVQSALIDRSRREILAGAQATAAASGKSVRQYSYCVSAKGEVGGAGVQQQFENVVFRTLNDARGWPRAGATFTYSADSGQCDFVVYLAQPSLMTSFSDNCSDKYSCRVGNDVIINEARWNGATERMLQAGMSLDRYRSMVINHEVGHRLGHLDNEHVCPGPQALAPLMQEQSIDLHGCAPNEWPTDSELWID